MPKGPERRTERFTIRLPPALRDKVEKAAAHDRRSPSDWIVLALEAAVGEHPATTTAMDKIKAAAPRGRRG